MNDVRVIGIGSPFGADTLGWQVVRRLKQAENSMLIQCKNVELIEADRPGPLLIQLMQEAHYVILVDAIVDLNSVGKFFHLDKDQITNMSGQISSHDMGISDAIILAEKLALLPKKLSIIGMSVDPGQGIPLNETDLQTLTNSVIDELNNYFTQSANV